MHSMWRLLDTTLTQMETYLYLGVRQIYLSNGDFVSMKIFLLRFIMFACYLRSSYSSSRRSSGPLVKAFGVIKGVNCIICQYLTECRDTKWKDESYEHLAVVSKFTENFAERKTNSDVWRTRLIINKQKSEFSKY